MTTGTMKKGAVGLLLAVITGSSIYFHEQAREAHLELVAAQEQLRTATNELDDAHESIQGLKNRSRANEEMVAQQNAEIAKLRTEMGQLRAAAAIQLRSKGASSANVQNSADATIANQTPGQLPKATPRTLYELARLGNTNGFKALLDTYPELISVGSGEIGSTPLHTASNHKNLYNIEELLKHNANVNAQNQIGFTPLHDAIMGDGKPGSKAVVELLIKNGADLTLRSLAGQTPLAYAVSRNQEELAEIIRDAGGKE